jgi:hypothetical protein
VFIHLAHSFSHCLLSHFFGEGCLYFVDPPNFNAFLSFGSYTVLAAMSHLRTIEPPSAVPGIGRSAPHSRQGHTLKPDTLATVAARHRAEDKTQEHIQAVEPTDPKVLAEEDDEVQFVFWAPLRKKKKRKRCAY